MKSLKPFNARWLAGVALLLAPPAFSQGRIGTTSQPLISETPAVLWTGNGNKIPVCWENAGWDREKKLIKDAVTNTWQFYANVEFTGWNICPTTGDAQHVRVRLADHPSDANQGADGSARVGMGALSKASDNNPGVNFSLKTDGTAGLNRVEYLGVHEFGHVLGFAHEQDADENEDQALCNDGVNPGTDPVVITAYDRDSIMNYCNRDGNGTGLLSDIDVQGVQRTYGFRNPNLPPLNSCASAPTPYRTSLAAAWNDYANTSVAVFPVAGAQFQYHNHWAIRQGGWGDTVKWASGDFDGDRRTDIAAAWNNGGSTTLTVRLSTGATFNAAHWLANAGGWSDTSVLQSGDFNGDGLADLAVAWNDSNNTSVAVYLSTGSSFLPPQQWALRDGGWNDTVKWAAGDFNRDGRTDLVAAWNNNGATTLTVRLATRGGFQPAHWSADAGRWFDSAVIVAGDFDGNGYADVAQLWNDLNNTSIRVSLSNGAQFLGASAWGTRDGGWGRQVKFIPGDFNGDGKTDIAAAWNNNGTNTLTVRASNGEAFVPAHWSVNNGGWIDSTAWCSGSYH